MEPIRPLDPREKDMRLLLNSMLHASVSVNIASTMSLESFALNLPTINVAMRSSEDVENPTLMWSFDMFHTSDHYKALVDNGAVDVARNIDELVGLTIEAFSTGHDVRRRCGGPWSRNLLIAMGRRHSAFSMSSKRW